MLHEFNISEIEEIIEQDEIYTIMNKRIFYCKNLASSDMVFGPADICYLVKESHTKGFFGIGGKKVVKQGCYHYVYGLDTSNIAFISVYISKFIHKLPSSNFKVTQSIFCIYDFFLEKDLRILVKFPGGVRKVFYIDDHQAVESTAEDLKTVFLSSLLRSWKLQDWDKNSVFLEELNNSDSFNYLIECINYLVKGKNLNNNRKM
jgi:hypothetical protein